MSTIRALTAVHRYLGTALCVVLFTWFASGVVMMYAGYPLLSERVKLERAPRLDWSTATVSLVDAVQAVQSKGPFEHVRLGMLLDRPAYFLFGRNQEWTTVYADDGRVSAGIDADQARQVAREFYPEAVPSDVMLLRAPDQWTIFTGWAPYIAGHAFSPTYRLEMADDAETVVYVTRSSGDVIGRNTRSDRLWGYLGAVVHWIYPTRLRTQAPGLWNDLIVWLSALGTIACLLGFVPGLYYLRWRRKQQPLSPYKGMLAWHHYLGLAFGVGACTWLFSGLLSMDPWSWSQTDDYPLAAQQASLRGGPFVPQVFTLPGSRAGQICASRLVVKEIRLTQLQGRPYYECVETPYRTLLVAADASEPATQPHFTTAELVAASRGLVPGAAVAEATMLTGYDAYYYPQYQDKLVNDGRKPLPVLRLVFDDGDRTLLYVDAASGLPVRSYGASARAYRWLFHGLHSLDLPGLYASRPLWDAIMLPLMIGGSALALTGIWTGVTWSQRAIRTSRRRRQHRAGAGRAA